MKYGVLAASASDPPLPQPRVSLPGSGVRAPSGLFRRLRMRGARAGTGPGLGALLLIILAAVLAGTAVFLRLRHHASPVQHIKSVEDAAQSVTPAMPTTRESEGPGSEAVPPGSMTRGGAGSEAASLGSMTRGSVEPDAVERPAAGTAGGRPFAPSTDGGYDAGLHAKGAGLHANDARAPAKDAGPPASGAGSASAGMDKVTEAKALYDKAHDALDEGDFTRALELSDASLKLRKTARTYLLRAQAEQRLDRIDAALASVDAAAQIAPQYSAVWEMRGRILWVARRHEEARAAFEKFLELDPNSPRAAFIQRLMNEPR